MDTINLRLHLNRVGTIPDDSPVCQQSTTIHNIVLKKHQLQTIYAMSVLEENRKRINTHEYLISEIGVLSNKVGSGKSLCVLGLVANNVRLCTQDFVTCHFGDSVFVMDDRQYMNIKGGNLIVVPNHLISIWEDYLMQYTTFRYAIIRKRMFPIDWENIEPYDIVLCSAKYYNMLIKTCPWIWSRVIFDEADSINIPACTKPPSRFVWFVSSSLNNLLFCNGHYWRCNENSTLTRVITRGITRQGYIKSTFKELESMNADTILPGIIVKMNDTYVDQYIQLPPVHEHLIRCTDPIYLRVLRDVLPESIESLLNGCDTTGALDHLGCPVDKKENIISYICRSLHVQKRNYELKLNYLSNMETFDSETYENLSTKVKKTNDKIYEIDLKLKNIHTKINQFVTDSIQDIDAYCPICMEQGIKDLCLFACCLNVFCKNCVQQLVQHSTKTCPLCRNDMKTNNILLQSKHTTNETKYDKITGLLKHIISKDARQILIFVWHDNTLNKISHILTSQHFNFRVLSGNTNTIKRVVQWFNDGKIKVLVVNASLYGCGLNLTNATDIIFFQKMSPEIEVQLLGRAYRLGRTIPLHLHRILHEDE